MTVILLRCVALCAVLAAGASAIAEEVGGRAVFLVAAEQIRDPNFAHSVVLLTYESGGQPFGVIINRPLHHRLDEIFPEHPQLRDRHEELYFGGPVARGALVFLLRSADPPPHGIPAFGDVYFTGDVAWINTLAQPPKDLRVYVGYAGWTGAQLQNEIQRGDWHVVPANAETIFREDPESVWPALNARATMIRTRLRIEERGSGKTQEASAEAAPLLAYRQHHDQ